MLISFPVGFISLKKTQRTLFENIEFSKNYFQKFEEMRSSYDVQEKFRKLLDELITDSRKMQRFLGYAGIFAFYSEPPFDRAQYKNYEALVNILPKARNLNLITVWNEVEALRNCFLLRFGEFDELSEKISIELRNPLKWFVEGVNIILASPISILRDFGVIKIQRAEDLKNSQLVRILTALTAIISLLASLFQIFSSWDETMYFIQNTILYP